jgi:hypothetical protein
LEYDTYDKTPMAAPVRAAQTAAAVALIFSL